MIQASLIFLSSLIISWLPNVEQDLTGYRVYYGTLSGVYSDTLDVGANTSYTITGLDSSLTYYFSVTAYDFSGNESNFSTEVSYIWSEPDSANVGDVNFDGIVDIEDRVDIKAFLGYPAIENQSADVNGDYIIDILDRITIKEYFGTIYQR
jgi:hypothetical protein